MVLSESLVQALRVEAMLGTESLEPEAPPAKGADMKLPVALFLREVLVDRQ